MIKAAAMERAFTSFPRAVPVCWATPVKTMSLLYALKHSVSSWPSSPPSTVYACFDLISSSGTLSIPWPVSSSGLKQTSIVLWLNSGCALRKVSVCMIAVIPDLSSAPRSVVPSLVIIVSPSAWCSCGFTSFPETSSTVSMWAKRQNSGSVESVPVPSKSP